MEDSVRTTPPELVNKGRMIELKIVYCLVGKPKVPHRVRMQVSKDFLKGAEVSIREGP